MENNSNFTEKLNLALTEKADWFNKVELPRMLECYRLLHTCVKNLFEILEKRGLIISDPYKLDQKISDITIPDDSPYKDGDKAMVIGARFSDYESMLDFICTYFKFSVENISLQKIRKLNEFNNSFQWNNCSPNNSKINTKAIANFIVEVKKSAPSIVLNMVNDSVNKSASSINEITGILKELTEYQKEAYKAKLRLDIFCHPSFNKEKAAASASDELAEIKRMYVEVIGKKTFYHELVSEIVQEDHSPNKEALQFKVLQKLKVKSTTVEKEKKQVDTKQIIVDAVSALATLGNEYSLIRNKVSSNHLVLESSHNTFFDKLKKALRKMFNLPDPPIFYNLTISDKTNQTHYQQKIDISVFMSNLDRKANFFITLQNKESSEFKTILASTEENILIFVNKQITENQEIFTYLTAIDEYFKANAKPQDKSKIKGLKMDLVSVKNAIVKANQRRGEYASHIEEIAQLKRLGINDAD